jgi:hypothetical protein
VRLAEVFFKLLGATANLDQHTFELIVAVYPVGPYQVQVVPDIDDRDGEVVLNQNCLDGRIQLVSPARPEWDGRRIKQLIEVLLLLLEVIEVKISIFHFAHIF